MTLGPGKVQEPGLHLSQTAVRAEPFYVLGCCNNCGSLRHQRGWALAPNMSFSALPQLTDMGEGQGAHIFVG